MMMDNDGWIYTPFSDAPIYFNNYQPTATYISIRVQIRGEELCRWFW